jgi:hypothetical protein
VDAVAVGSGKALQLARRGDADMTLTHDPEIEEVFLSEQRASLYRKIMYNDFLIVGPESDPAGTAQAASASGAMRRIAVSTAAFASRGDSSGTDDREKLLWKRAGASPPGPRLLETGQAMSPTLRVASEKRAYCLTDRATFAQLEDRLALHPLYQGGPELLNTYAVMVVRHAGAPPRRRPCGWPGGWPAGRARADRRFQDQGRRCAVWPDGVPRDTPGALPRRTRDQLLHETLRAVLLILAGDAEVWFVTRSPRGVADGTVRRLAREHPAAYGLARSNGRAAGWRRGWSTL